MKKGHLLLDVNCKPNLGIDKDLSASEDRNAFHDLFGSEEGLISDARFQAPAPPDAAWTEARTRHKTRLESKQPCRTLSWCVRG